jgi:hypothetical protein
LKKSWNEANDDDEEEEDVENHKQESQPTQAV